MIRRGLFLVTVAVVSILTGCGKKDNGIRLNIDYSAKNSYGYSMTYASEGFFTQNDSTSSMKTELICDLIGSANDNKEKLVITVKDVSIVSSMMEDDEKMNIVEQLKGAEYALSLDGGYPVIDTAAKLPAGSFHEWDLYRQFAKIMPSMPAQNVKPGFSWERTFVLPVETTSGKVPCEVYHSYTFDSTSADGSLAYIQWKFRYLVSEKAIDSASIMKKLPVSGNGDGSAIIDMGKNVISEAAMTFKTPVATIGDISITWQEKATIKYAE